MLAHKLFPHCTVFLTFFFFFLRQSLTSLLAWELGLLLPQPPNRSSKDLKVLQQSSGLMSVNRNLHLLNKYLLSLYSWSRRCVHLRLWLLNLQTKRMWTESGPLQWVITNILSCSNCQLFLSFIKNIYCMLLVSSLQAHRDVCEMSEMFF